MGFAATLASNVIYRILNISFLLGTMVVLSRLCGPSGFGILSLLIVNIAFLNLVTSFGIDSSVTYQVASDRLNPYKIFSFIFLVLIMQSLVAGIVEFIASETKGAYLIYPGTEKFRPIAAIVLLVAISLTEKYTSLFNGKHLFSFVNRLLALTNGLIFLVFLVVLISSPGMDTDWIISFYIALTLFQAMVLVVCFHSVTGTPLRFLSLTRQDFRLFFSYSIIAFAANFLQFLAYRIDYWFIDFYRGEDDLGIYALAVRLVQLFWILPLVYASIIFPKVTAAKKEYDHQPLLALIRVTNTVNLIAGIVACVTAGWLIPFFFGAAYNSSVNPFLVLLPGVIAFSMTTILASWFAGMNLLRINLTGSAICFIVIVILDVLLIPRYGVNGAAVASSTGYFLSSVYSVSRYCRITGHGLLDLLLTKSSDWQKARSLFKRYINLHK
jgi:O-antigen/teichoic acid export membrane protein